MLDHAYPDSLYTLLVDDYAIILSAMIRKSQQDTHLPKVSGQYRN